MRIKQMTNAILFFGLFLLAGPVIAQQKPAVHTPEEKPVFKTLKEKQSYAMGIEMLRNLKRQKFDFDLNFVMRGMKDADTGGKLAMTDDEMLEMLNISASEARMMKTSDQLVAGQENKKAEEEFLAQNESKEGVVKLPSGLQYKIIKDGNGEKPTSEESVQVNYRGTLVDGAKFDSTYESGQPATIKVSNPHVIAGLREALKLMPVGAKWQLFIPSRLAYGQRPSGRIIGPYSMLIYELEILSIQK
jgi:FKBP-type peptidyl-prolyl cis-trans isomerase FklB